MKFLRPSHEKAESVDFSISVEQNYYIMLRSHKMKILNRLNLFNKLFLGYLILLSIMIVPCAVSIFSLSRLERFATSVAKHEVELSKTIEYLKGILPSMEAEGRRLVTLNKEDAYNSLQSLIADFRDNLIQVKRDGPEEIRIIIENIEANLDEFAKLVHTAKASSSDDIQPEITPVGAQREKNVKALISMMMAELNRMERTSQRTLSLRSSTISTLSSSAREITVMLLVGAIAAFAFIAPFFLLKYIKRPIDHLRRGTEIVGQGNFDHSIPVFSRDELGQLAEAFNNMAIRLKELDTLKSDFIGVASHELKTPLTSMMEAAKLLAEPKVGKLNEKQQKLVNILNESMSRFQTLINELLQLSRLKARLDVIEKRPMDITKVFSDVIQTLRPMLWEKKLDLKLVPVSGLEKQVPIDEERMFRAFMNILHNAVKFSPENQEIKIVLDQTENKGKGWLKIAIVDAGPGIEESETEKVFDKFYQIQSVRKKAGSGLGLAIAKEIILAHGGKIWVESPPPEHMAVSPGKGTAFCSLLPYSA